jgi:ABC-type branched-subunit amino acid transport system substrate-binding protein
MMRRSKLLLPFVVAGLLAAPACGSDDDGGDDAASTTSEASQTTETTVALTGDPVKIMVMFEGTGSVATPEVPEGAIAAAEAINASGGIDGSPIEVTKCDLSNDPNTARECGQQAVDDGMVAVVGPVSANAGEYMPLLEAAQIPVIGNVPASAADFTSPASFPLYGGIVTASAGLADVLASEAGATTISIARIDLAAAAAISVFANKSLERSGQAINNDVSVPVGAPDMATYVASALQGGTDGVLVGLTGQDATNFIIQLRQTNPDIPISATTTEFDAVVEALGDAADGIYVTGFFEDATTNPEAYKQFTDDLEAAGFDEFGGFRSSSYSAVQLVAKVLTGMQERTGPALWAALPTAGEIDLPMLPPVQFAQGGVGGLPRLFNPCGLYRQLDGGKITTLTDGFIDMMTGEPC